MRKKEKSSAQVQTLVPRPDQSLQDQCYNMSGNGDKSFPNHETAGYVGFANLPNQVHRKSVKKGFEFTLMVVGESGLGKSTLINSLFLTDLYPGQSAVGEM